MRPGTVAPPRQLVVPRYSLHPGECAGLAGFLLQEQASRRARRSFAERSCRDAATPGGDARGWREECDPHNVIGGFAHWARRQTCPGHLLAIDDQPIFSPLGTVGSPSDLLGWLQLQVRPARSIPVARSLEPPSPSADTCLEVLTHVVCATKLTNSAGLPSCVNPRVFHRADGDASLWKRLD